MTTERPVWAGPDGLPTAHALRAALHVAATIDQAGSRVVDARESYWHKATGGLFAPPDLDRGQQLLVDCDLVREQDGTLYPRPALEGLLVGEADAAVAAIYTRVVEQGGSEWHEVMVATELAGLIPDPTRREELLLALARRFDDERQRLVGAIGEEVVVAALRSELEGLGYPELARAVRHLSLESDQLGYDVSAPRVAGERRLIEVKATTQTSADAVVVHVSRNEAEVGLRYRDWALVVCLVTDLGNREGAILGWVPGDKLEPILPNDAEAGRWETAELTIGLASLWPGFPSAT